MILKYCTRCHELKTSNEFFKKCNAKDGFDSGCKSCQKTSKRTKQGLIQRNYGNQRANSRRRNEIMPDYSLNCLREWVLCQPLFHKLYDEWVVSGYKKELVPSFDRTDDSRPYSLSRLTIMTWEENSNKYRSDVKKGVYKKYLKPVVQMTMNGDFVAEHYSINDAERKTGVCAKQIHQVLRHKSNYAKGYRWMRSIGIPIYNNQAPLEATDV